MVRRSVLRGSSRCVAAAGMGILRRVLLLRGVLVPAPSATTGAIGRWRRGIVKGARILRRLGIPSRVVAVVRRVRISGVIASSKAAPRRHIVVDVRPRGVVRLGEVFGSLPISMGERRSRSGVSVGRSVVDVASRPVVSGSADRQGRFAHT